MRMLFAYPLLGLALALSACAGMRPSGTPAEGANRPGPGTRLGAKAVKAVFDMDARRTRKAMEAHVPSRPVGEIVGRRYLDGDQDALLDVYFPGDTATSVRLPVVVWLHGGAWLSGSRRDAAPYFRLIAAAGYAVVAPDYSLAPDSTYPRPVHQLNSVLAYLRRHADEFHADVSRVVLAGDSAGAQLAAQLAALGSNPAYAAELGLPAAFTPDVVRGMVLNCGAFDLEKLAAPRGAGSRILGWGTRTTVMAYAGTRDPASPILRQMTVIHHATGRFPPTWISGGNADPLTDGHSRPLAARLRALDVPVTELFYPADHRPKLEHEYQFDLDNDDGRKALASILAFLDERTRRP